MNTKMIWVENLSKKFGELTAVDNLSFEVCKNEIFGLLGPNGAGKSTTINMLCGLLEPSSGKIHFAEGLNRSAIGYCPQENIFYPKLTCLEQLLFIGQLYDISQKQVKKNAEMLLEMMGLNGKQNTLAGKSFRWNETATQYCFGANSRSGNCHPR